MPDAASEQESVVYKGNKRTTTRECIILIDQANKRLILERLSSAIHVKRSQRFGAQIVPGKRLCQSSKYPAENILPTVPENVEKSENLVKIAENSFPSKLQNLSDSESDSHVEDDMENVVARHPKEYLLGLFVFSI
ncbi:uncharacterized protein LOC115228703 [Octopus sinensis]|uniref:Uncharacterized protein LOC115228703 n=1 Tax=Octopus sinensis TaxID=2607531 RepID=A0A6P7TTL6_9MOLL|nr:uncharacterized protein LOC115228703 [Octopus sinensis]